MAQPGPSEVHTNSYLGGKGRKKGARMAELTTEARNSLPDSAFVFPSDRRYPIHDLSHARNALARAAQNGTPAEQAKVKSAVYAKYPALKKSEEVQVEVPIWRSDEHHLVYGTVYTPGQYDAHGDKMSGEEIRKMAHGYLEASRQSDLQHSGQAIAGVKLVESACAPHDMVFGGKLVKSGAWFTAHKITDGALWERVSKEDHPKPLTGLSFGGRGLRLPEEAGVERVMALGKSEGPEVDDALSKADLFDVAVDFVSFVDRAASRDPSNPAAPQPFLLYKRESTPTPTEGGNMPAATLDKSALAPEVREALEKAEQDAATAQAELEKATKGAADEKAAREAAEAKLAQMKKEQEPEPTPIDKSALPEAARLALEKAEADNAAMAARLTKAEEATAAAAALAKAEQDQRVTAEYIAKAATGDLRGLPSAPAEVGPLLKRLAEASPEAYAELEKDVLAPAAAQLAKSELFKEAGVGGEGPPPESAAAELEKAVTELRKSETSLSKEAAVAKVQRLNPDLAKRLSVEMRGA